ncbi:TPA: LysR family transcriptional regulator [Klebsiella pneumoniae]|nr:LysR family transcriptional regulator [Klebsiella pneumoniae]
MLNLQRVTMFIAVVDAGSFTLAAAALGQTKAVVSFNVRQLENELGVTLLLRSTRRLRLTDAGVLFYQRGVALLNAAENLQDEVRASHSGLSGELRITTTPEYGEQVIIPALAAFARRHPALRVRHVSSSHHADLISERFDVAIRLGTLADSRYRATRIASFAILPVASPAWLALVVAIVKLVVGVLIIALFENSMARLRFCATSRVTWAGFGFAFLAFVSLLVA